MAEIIAIVNEADEVIGSVEKEKFDKTTGQIYRTASLFLFDKQGRILIQRRAFSKKTAGGKWDFSAAAGHVAFDENYLECIARETEEELGLKGLDFFEIKKEFVRTEQGKRRFVAYFLAVADFSISDLRLPENEVAEVKLLTVLELRDVFKNHREEFADYSSVGFSNLADGFLRLAQSQNDYSQAIL